MWNRIWYQPVEAARSRLLARSVLLLLAFDIWLLMIPRAALYGSAGFNVAHFAWLDAAQPLPTAGVYIALLVWTSVLALSAALGPLRRLPVALACLLYTYAWSMSLLDSYQHHYLLSWALWCFALLPRGGRADSPPTSAWSFQLLGAIVAVMYLYAAVSKLDPGWLSGATARRWLAGSLAGSWPDADPDLWRLASWIIIGCEFLLAAGYAAAVCLGEPARRRGQIWRGLMFAAAVSMHVGVALAGLRIGWFTLYMLLVASAFFLPGPWLAWLDRRLPSWDVGSRPQHGLGQAAAALAACCIVSVAVAAVVRLPGLPTALGVTAGVVAVGLAWGWRRGVLAPWISLAARVSVVCAVMGLTLLASSASFRYLATRGQDLQTRGQPQAAVEVLTEAGCRQLLAGRRLRAERQHALALAYRDLGRHDDALACFREATMLWPQYAAAHFHEGNLLRQLGRPDQARSAYRDAIAADPGMAAAYNNLGAMAAEAGELEQAEQHFQQALQADPNLAEAEKKLGWLFLQHQDLARARRHFQASVSKNPLDAEARHAVGNVCDLLGELDAASEHYRQALELRPQYVPALFDLGTVYARQGQFDAAIRQFERALEIDPQHDLSRQAIENVRAVRDDLRGRP